MGLVVAVSLVVLVVVIGVVVAVSNSGSSSSVTPVTPRTTRPPAIADSPVTASTVLSADRGQIVFTDDFSDPSSGWTTVASLADPGTTYGYVAGGYAIHGNGTFQHFANAPYGVLLPQLSVSVVGTQTAGVPSGLGFGAICRSGTGTAVVRYEFFLVTGSRWLVERSNANGAVPVILKEGTSPVAPGATPVTIVGMCATEADGQTNRLAFFVNGVSVTDITDTPAGLSGGGWRGGVAVSSRSGATSTVTVSRYVERDISRS